MKQVKTLLTVLLVLITASVFIACDQNADGTKPYSGTSAPTPPTPDGLTYLPANPSRPTGKSIGISFPEESLRRWKNDGNNIKKILEAAGYDVYLAFTEGNTLDEKTDDQIDDINTLISKWCDVLIIAPVNGNSLTQVLENTRESESNPYSIPADITVIAYDRLIMGSDKVSYYATFDNRKAGQLQGDYIEDAFDLSHRTAEDPIYMEFFTGDPNDNNINFFFGGAMYVLSPYLTSGVIVCPSGQTTQEQCAILNWSTENAYDRMDNLIDSYDPDTPPLDAVLCSNDSTAQGVTGALVDAGYTADNFPVITGQDCDIYSVRNIKKGLQSMSVFKDTRTLVSKVCEMADAIIVNDPSNYPIPVNNTTTYNNNSKYVDSYLCDPMVVDKNNYVQTLIYSGYYTATELN